MSTASEPTDPQSAKDFDQAMVLAEQLGRIQGHRVELESLTEWSIEQIPDPESRAVLADYLRGRLTLQAERLRAHDAEVARIKAVIKAAIG